MISYLDDGNPFVALAGEYDLANADTIHRQVHDALEHGAMHIAVDTAAVGFLDAAALSALVRARKECMTARVGTP